MCSSMSVATLVFETWPAWNYIAQPLNVIGQDFTEVTASTACIIATPLMRDLYIKCWKVISQFCWIIISSHVNN